MTRIYANERPRLKEVGRTVNPVTHTTLINFDVREENSEQGKFSYLQVEMYPSQMNRIRSRFDQDQMEAVMNNYLENPADEEALADFTEMQNWRKQAKAIAKEALEA